MEKIKVSVIMPSLNVVKYIRLCIESVINQTLEDIEIICVDAGSTDGTIDILEEYASKDQRISIIHSEKKSYGYQMNLGMDAAEGKYMGIVETDDYADLDMFETLYRIAEDDNLDMVKSGYYNYYTEPEENNIPIPITSHVFSQRVFCPLTDFNSPKEHAEFFNIKPTIWSAIYRIGFLRDNNIRFNETPGASFQDCSFNFKVLSLAKRVRLIEDCFLHYRQDNASSSVNSPSTAFCVLDEYKEIDAFLEDHSELKQRLKGIECYLKYNTYIWNYNRLNDALQLEFIRIASDEFCKERALGYFDKKYFPYYKWNTMNVIADKPKQFHEYMKSQKEGNISFRDRQPVFNESMRDKLFRNVRKFKRYVALYGWKITMIKAMKKIRRIITR